MYINTNKFSKLKASDAYIYIYSTHDNYIYFECISVVVVIAGYNGRWRFYFKRIIQYDIRKNRCKIWLYSVDLLSCAFFLIFLAAVHCVFTFYTMFRSSSAAGRVRGGEIREGKKTFRFPVKLIRFFVRSISRRRRPSPGTASARATNRQRSRRSALPAALPRFTGN